MFEITLLAVLHQFNNIALFYFLYRKVTRKKLIQLYQKYRFHFSTATLSTDLKIDKL